MSDNAEIGADWERIHRDLLSRIGFGDGITEPMADNDTVVEFIDQVVMDSSEHRECAIACELCGERLADTLCEHCHGTGADNARSQAAMAYAECEWCAGAGKVHEGCVERTYSDLAEAANAAEVLRERIRQVADAYRRSWRNHAGASTLDTDVAQMLRNLLVENRATTPGADQ